MGIYEYVIQVTGTTVSADPVDTTIGLPSMPAMAMAAGLLGEVVEPTVGKICYVVFLNGDRTKPRVIGAEGNSKTIEVESTESMALTSPDFTVDASTVAINAGMTTIGSGSTGVATAGTTASLIALLSAERTAYIAFLNSPLVVVAGAGTTAPAAAASAAVITALALPTNFSQTVKAGA